MHSHRKLLGAAAFSLALAGGGMVGAALGTPSPSGAQEDDTTEATPGAHAVHPGHRGPRGEGLDTAAGALGISAEELRTELEAGRSIAQVAEERGVDVDTVVDALVAKGTERLEAAIAALPERVGEMVAREGLPERRGPGGRGPRRGDEPADAPADAEAPAES